MKYKRYDSETVPLSLLSIGNTIVIGGKFYIIMSKTTAISYDGQIINLFDGDLYEKVLRGRIEI